MAKMKDLFQNLTDASRGLMIKLEEMWEYIDKHNTIIVRPECIWNEPWQYYPIGFVRQKAIETSQKDAEGLKSVTVEYHHVVKRKIYL